MSPDNILPVPTAAVAAPASRLASLSTMLGLLLTILGAMVMAGWLLQERAIVELRSGLEAMMFNSALGFTVAGSALVLPNMMRRPLGMLQRLAGAFLLGMGSLILAEHITGRDLGVDFARLHSWLRDGNTRPGRTAPSTAVGFMLAGACFIALNHIASRVLERLFQTLLFCLATVGIAGLLGYLIAPAQLFGWDRSARMTLHTAVGMILMALALWDSWYAQRGRAARFFSLDKKIGFTSAAILCIGTLTAGLTGFVFQQSVLEQSLRDKLRFTLDGERRMIQMIIRQARLAADHAQRDPHLIEPAYARAQGRNDATPTGLDREMRGLIANGFASATLLTPGGTVLYHAGETVPHPAARLDLPERGRERAYLTWSNGVILVTEVPMVRNEQQFATLHLVQRLPVLLTQLNALRGLGTSGELLLCAGRPTTLVCMPSKVHSAMYEVPRTSTAQLPLPMSHAVDGGEGLIAAVDYRGANVMAAYAPVAPNIGLVIKQDTAELYGVVRTQLAFFAPALALLLVAGVALMRRQLRPLVNRLVVSERQANDKQLELNTLVSSVAEGIITINEQGLIESYNRAAAAIFGYSAAEVLGRPLAMLTPEDNRAALEAGIRAYLHTGIGQVIGRPNVELPGLRKDGARFTLEVTITEIRYESRRIFVGIMRDISERKLAEQKLLHMAQHDVLTGLPNRALFMDRLASAAMRANRGGGALAVLFLDLDGFKKINDSMGHHSGDELLRQFGERLSAIIRKSDTVARLAGDEFTLILEELNDPERDARALADKIIVVMQAPFTLSAGIASVTTSIGLVVHVGAGAVVTDLLRRADDAMYRAKFSGKNRWSV